MARPTKQGIDYFPLDCQFDDKIEMYLIEKGAIGLGVLITLWQMIYTNEGYYITDNKDLHLLIKRKIDVDVNEVSDCINICLERNVFSQELHHAHSILTSKAVQKRYFEAAKKKKSVAVIDDYVINGIDSVENWVISSGNATNVNVKEEVKVEVKVNKPIHGGLNITAWEIYEKYRRDSKYKKLKPVSVEKQQEWLVEQGPPATQMQVVEQTVKNGWQGLFELKGQGNGTNQQTHAPKLSLAERASENRRKFESTDGSPDGKPVGANDTLVRA